MSSENYEGTEIDYAALHKEWQDKIKHKCEMCKYPSMVFNREWGNWICPRCGNRHRFGREER